MSDFSLGIAFAPIIPHRFLAPVFSLCTSGPSQAEDVFDYWRQGHIRGDGDIGSSQLAFLHRISTTKGNYFVAAQSSCFHPSPGFRKHDSYALNASRTTHRCPSSLLLCHCSKLPVLQWQTCSFLPSGVPHSDLSPFLSNSFPWGRDQTSPLSHKFWLLCLLSSNPQDTLAHLRLQ